MLTTGEAEKCSRTVYDKGVDSEDKRADTVRRRGEVI